MKIFDTPLSSTFDMYGAHNISTYEHIKFLDDRSTFSLKVEVKVKMKPYDIFTYLARYFPAEKKFNFLSHNFYIRDNDLIIITDFDTFGQRENSAGRYTIKLIGADYERISSIKEEISSHFSPFEVNSIVWAIMAPNGEIINKEMDISRKYHEAITEFYPFMKGVDLDDYFDRYLASEENILLLVGDPGTGKTTFIKNLLIKKKLNAIITYDEKLMKDDGFFLEFITGDKDVLIIEDADTLIYDREKDDNSIMSKILNVSDGIIKNVEKKIIFSTNITDINRIDSALMRPGRCFDTLDFRKLSFDEATAILKILNRDKVLDPDKRFFTLAEVLSHNSREQHFNKHKVGF